MLGIMTIFTRDKRLNAKLPIFAAVAMAGANMPAHAAYDQADHVWIAPEATYWYDSNVFRIGDHADTVAYLGNNHREDYIFQPKVSAHIDADLSRQKISYDGSVYSRSYQEHSSLNYVGTNQTLAWDWVIGSDLKGTISYNLVRDLSAFEDIASAQKDMRTGNILSLDAQYQITSNIAVLSEFGYDKERHSSKTELDLAATALAGGLQYKTDSGNSVTYRHDHNTISYEESYNNGIQLLTASERGYTQDADQIILEWLMTPDLLATVNVGRAAWEYDDDTTKNTSNFGGADLKWAYSPKTIFELSYVKQISVPSQSLYTSMSNEYKAMATWKATEKLTFMTIYKFTKQDYSGSYERTDKTNYYRISAEWQPFLNWDFQTYLERQKRNSDNENYKFNNNTIGINAKYKF